jgi:hypothetical protein
MSSTILDDVSVTLSDEVTKRVYISSKAAVEWMCDSSFSNTNGPIDRVYEVLVENILFPTHEYSRIEEFSQKIYNLEFPGHWVEEGINKPNILAKDNAVSICKQLYTRYNLIPSSILPTKEEGIYIDYDNFDSDKSLSLIIETYNDSATAVVVYDNINNNTLYSEDINELNFEKAVRSFKE